MMSNTFSVKKLLTIFDFANIIAQVTNKHVHERIVVCQKVKVKILSQYM